MNAITPILMRVIDARMPLETAAQALGERTPVRVVQRSVYDSLEDASKAHTTLKRYHAFYPTLPPGMRKQMEQLDSLVNCFRRMPFAREKMAKATMAIAMSSRLESAITRAETEFEKRDFKPEAAALLAQFKELGERLDPTNKIGEVDATAVAESLRTQALRHLASLKAFAAARDVLGLEDTVSLLVTDIQDVVYMLAWAEKAILAEIEAAGLKRD